MIACVPPDPALHVIDGRAGERFGVSSGAMENLPPSLTSPYLSSLFGQVLQQKIKILY